MNAAAAPINAMTVDVEDYFHVDALSKVISRDETGTSASAPTLSAFWYALSKSARDLASNEWT